MTNTLTKIVWREWFNASAVKQLTEMGTLPRYETMIDCSAENGHSVAELVAADAYSQNADGYGENWGMVIVEPAEFAGTYNIEVDYKPTFCAIKTKLD